MTRRRHARTLDRVFAQPTPPDLRWDDVTAMLRSLGAYLEEREGSRVCVELGERRLVLHRPHPSPCLKRSAVRDLRDFLLLAGVQP